MSSPYPVGAELPLWAFGPVRPEAMATIAALIGDPNPIHFDPAAVAALGMGSRRVNQGPANLAYLTSMLEAAFGTGRLRRLTARFLASVYEGDSVTAGGTVTAVTDVADGSLVECVVWLAVDGGRRAVEATALLRV